MAQPQREFVTSPLQYKQNRRYIEYVDRQELYQHFDQVIIQDVNAPDKNINKSHMLQFFIPTTEQIIEQGTLHFKPPTQLRNQQFTRQSIQIMNKKLRQLRKSHYLYQNNNEDFKEHTRARSSLQSRRATYYQDSQKQYIIPEIKGVATHLETVKRKQPKRALSSMIHRNRKSQMQFQRLTTPLKTDKLKQKKMLSLQSNRKVHKQKKETINRIQSKNPYENQMILNQFKTKLKKKSVDDNLNVMASMIRKKVKVLNQKQMYQYISNLMNRNQKAHY